MKTTRIAAIFALLAMLTGCWSNSWMNELAFVMGIALDRGDGNISDDYMVTIQVAKPAVLINSGSTNGTGELAYANFSEHGVGVQEPLNRLSRTVERTLYTGHNQVLVIGRDAAENDIAPILDFFVRSSDGRPTLVLFVAEESAKDIFEISGSMEHLSTAHLHNLMSAQRKFREIGETRILDFLTAMLSNTTAPTVPIVGVIENTKGERELKLTGMAVFKGSRMQSVLSPEQSQSMLMIQNKVDSGLIRIDAFDGYISTDINYARSSVKPEFTDDDLEKIVVSLDIGCSIADMNIELDLVLPEVRDEVAKLIEDYLLKRLGSIVDYAQENNIDIFGFGEKLFRYHPRKSKQLIENWDTAFSELKVEFDVNVEILSSKGVLQPLYNR